MKNVQLSFDPDFDNSSASVVANVWSIKKMNSEDKILFEKFCSLFTFASNQPNQKELCRHIKVECKDSCRKQLLQLTTDYLQNKIRKWFKVTIAHPLNSTFLKTKMEYIKNNEIEQEGVFETERNLELRFIFETEKNIEALSPLKQKFETIRYEEDIRSFLQQKVKNIFLINTNSYQSKLTQTVILSSEITTIRLYLQPLCSALKKES